MKGPQKKRTISISLLFLLAVLPLTAANGNGATLERILEALSENHPAFRSNEATRQASRAGYREARSALYPRIELTVPVSGNSLQYDYPSSAVYPDEALSSASLAPQVSISQLLPSSGTVSAVLTDKVEWSNYNSTSYQVTDDDIDNSLTATFRLSQPLHFGGAYQAVVTQIEMERESAELKSLAERNRLTLQALRDYYNYRQALYQVQLITARLKSDRETFRRVEREYELGLWTRAKTAQAQSALLQSEADLVKAEQSRDAAGRILEALYGLPPSQSGTGTAEALLLLPQDPGAPQDLGKAAREANPELQQLLNSIAVSRAELILKARDNAPRLESGVSYTYNQGISAPDERLHTVSLDLQISASLGDGGAFRHADARRRKTLRSLEAQLNNQEITLEARLLSLQDSVERNQKLIRIYSLQAEAADYDYQRGQKDFDLGQITRKELLDKQLALENARLSIQSAIIDRNLALLELYSTAGRDIYRWLTSSLSSLQEG